MHINVYCLRHPKTWLRYDKETAGRDVEIVIDGDVGWDKPDWDKFSDIFRSVPNEHPPELYWNASITHKIQP